MMRFLVLKDLYEKGDQIEYERNLKSFELFHPIHPLPHSILSAFTKGTFHQGAFCVSYQSILSFEEEKRRENLFSIETLIRLNLSSSSFFLPFKEGKRIIERGKETHPSLFPFLSVELIAVPLALLSSFPLEIPLQHQNIPTARVSKELFPSLVEFLCYTRVIPSNIIMRVERELRDRNGKSSSERRTSISTLFFRKEAKNERMSNLTMIP